MKKYKESGVDIKAGNEFVDEIKKINKDFDSNFKNNIGWFAGGFDISKFNLKEPVIFSSNDGVGTKLLLAIQNDNIRNIGQDLVAMSVNDLICHGAIPIFFLDYIGTNKILKKDFSIIIKNIVKNLNEFNCLLLGGETAELKDMYKLNEYDLCGMAVGICEKNNIIDPKNIEINDVIIGIESNGFHSNGYSLIRSIIKEYNLNLNKKYFNNQKLIDVLLKPTKIYVNCLLEINKKIKINAAAHITGGGLNENIKRILNNNQKAIINMKQINILEEFLFFQKLDNIDNNEMVKVFNLGIGFCVVVNQKYKNDVLKIIKKFNLKGNCIGKIEKGIGVDFIW